MLIENAYIEYKNQMILSITSFCGDEQTAKDAVSHAFLKAVSNKPILEQMPEPAMRAWLYAAARNAAIDIKRREKRYTPLDNRDVADHLAPDPSDHLIIQQLLSQLPPSLKQPVILKYYNGWNATEIGSFMGLSPATVRTRLRTAMKLMRREMKGDNDA